MSEKTNRVSDPVGEEVIRKLSDQLDHNGYFARFDGSSAFIWLRDKGLLDPYIALIRVYNYGQDTASEGYELQENGMLMNIVDSKEYDPIAFLNSEKAQRGWGVESFNPMRLRELAGE